MEHAATLHPVFPWRTAAVVLGAVAAVELLALLALGAVHLAPSAHHATARAPHVAAVRRVAAAHVPHLTFAPHPLRARSQVSVLVLNGNGVQGAAAAEAARLHALGYRFAGARNASRHDYAQSMVMYVPGWAAEARRLARDAGVRLVAPVDGTTPARLRGSPVVLILGT